MAVSPMFSTTREEQGTSKGTPGERGAPRTHRQGCRDGEVCVKQGLEGKSHTRAQEA